MAFKILHKILTQGKGMNRISCAIKLIIFVIAVSLFYFPGSSEASTIRAEEPNAGFNQEATNDAFLIQVASFRNHQPAEKEVDLLRSRGVQAETRHESVEGKGMWYRVYAGRYNTASSARQKAAELKNRGLIPNYWIKPETEGKKNGEKIIRLASDQKDTEKITRDSTPVSAGESKDGQGRFFLGVRAGGIFLPKADDFKIVQTTLSGFKGWTFDEEKIIGAINAEYQFHRFYSIQGYVERAFDTHADFWTLSLGPKFIFNPYKGFFPFFRANLIYGDLKWDDIPGDFDDGFGWEVALGIETTINRTKLGLEFSYRDIEFDYNIPPGGNVISNYKSLDFSGYGLVGLIGHSF